jgi:hypothetical protein
MKLKEYMETHEGEYLIAETTQTVTLQDLDDTLGDLEVEPHLHGDDAAGRRRIHLYAMDRPFHVVTHIVVEQPSDAESATT